MFHQNCSLFWWTTSLPCLLLTLPWSVHPISCPSMPLLLLLASMITPRLPGSLPPCPSFSSSNIGGPHWWTHLSSPSFLWILKVLQPLLYFPAGGGAWCLPAAAGWQSWREATPLWWVGVVGEGWVPEMFSIVAVVGVGETWCVVMIMVMVMMIRI